MDKRIGLEKPFISICIPAYKNVTYLERLFRSIIIQEYDDFEVIVTDDSPGMEVEQLCNEFASKMDLKYYRNKEPLGTPENWNEGIRKSSGEWIKIMHDDDWFNSSESLKEFAIHAKNTKNSLLFCNYYNYYLDIGKIELVKASQFYLAQIRQNANVLLSKNIIGPPSVIMHRNNGLTFYDNRFKWLVDIDFYIERLASEKLVQIKKPLINVGMSNQQVTASCFRVAEVEIPEHSIFLQKRGINSLRTVLVYDAWWRFIRNLDVASIDQLYFYSNRNWPLVINSIIKDVNAVPLFLRKLGLFSKLFMMISYVRNKRVL